MTDTAALPIEERLAAIEARLGVSQQALTPPITIGELTDVPAAGSQLAAQWAQEVSGRIVHRYANRAALDGWAAAAGSFAVTLDDMTLYRRKGGQWSRVTPYTASATGAGNVVIPSNNTFVQVVTLTIPTDAAPRLVDATWHFRLDRFPPYQHIARLLIDGTLVTQWYFAQRAEQNPGSGVSVPETAALVARNVAVAANKPIVVQGTIACMSNVGNGITYANRENNRLEISAVGA